jgi:hypothetical protein
MPCSHGPARLGLRFLGGSLVSRINGELRVMNPLA